jgi:redox-sensitive bicupin YhaK (pirin superfamily)
MMKIRRANERGHANHGWLDTYHSFSFADYYDPDWVGYRSLRVINDDLVMPGMGFGTHPHRDMEIITYILSGSLQHKDSMGNGRLIRTGELQYMAAGTGVQHSEFNPAKDEAVHFLQIWIQPDRKGVAPRYAEKSLKDAPAGKLQLVTSKSGRDGSISIHQDADLWLAKLGRPLAGEAGHRRQGHPQAGVWTTCLVACCRRGCDTQRPGTAWRRFSLGE